MKNIVQKQYQAKINEATNAPLQRVVQPKEGWIASVRKALGLSAAQLGRIVGHTRANIGALERSEQEARVTLQSLNTMAEAMGCKLVYAIVPTNGSVDDLILLQARKKARALVIRASIHMALEKQSLSDEQIEREIERVAAELLVKQPSDFWEVE